MPHRARWAPSRPQRVLAVVDPVGQRREVVVLEPESLPDGTEVGEIEHGGVREAAVEQFHQGAERAEEWERSARRDRSVSR